MAIDKLFPKNLNTDAEERLLQQGTMTDAMNITISEDGEGTASIAKNVRGTIPGEPLSNTDGVLNNKRIVAIGSASDSQRGFIYYIVADTSEGFSQSEHAIYQYNVTNDTYRLVFKDSRLNFDPASFVKVDVVNADFSRGGGLQTVLFFTDNVNPPRKINVDRAIGGEYSDINQDEFDYSLNCIKAPNVYEPTAAFTTDFSIDTNLFRDEAFQFATQIVYKDGEESAISPYSKLAIPTQLTIHNVEGVGFGLASNVDNVCIVNPNLSADGLISSPDISKLRILFRSGNEGAFNVADEVPLNVSTTRTVNGSSTTIFDGSSSFSFYNDRVALGVSPTEVNKLFDNVPFEAKGQTISGNRLMYSNYTEGRENTKISAELNVKYRSDDLVRKEYIDQTDDVSSLYDYSNTGDADLVDQTITQEGGSEILDAVEGNAFIQFQLKEAFGLEDASNAELEALIIPAGTVTNLSVNMPLHLFPQSLPANFTYTATRPHAGGQATCEVHITEIIPAPLSENHPVPANSGLFGQSYWPLTPGGMLDTPMLDVQIVTPTDVPFMSFGANPQQSYFDLFVANLEVATIQYSCYAEIKGTQGPIAWPGGNTSGIEPGIEQALGEIVSPEIGGLFEFPAYSVYDTNDHTIFVYGSPNVDTVTVTIPAGLGPGGADLTTTLQVDRHLYNHMSQRTGLVTINLGLDILSASTSSGEVACAIYPKSVGGWKHEGDPKILLFASTEDLLPTITSSGGIELPHVTNPQPYTFSVPATIPIDWPDNSSLLLAGGFIDNSSDLDYPALLTSQVSGAQTPGFVDISAIEDSFFFTNLYLRDKKWSVVKRSQAGGFKAGAIHNFGVVYYDKFNRSSFVNEIGNVYVEWFNKEGDNFRGDNQDPANYLDGPAAIEVQINNSPPEWAETYQVVYPGNASVSDFTQYTVGGAYPARVKYETNDQGEANLSNRDIDTESKRLYVSLETLDQYRVERNTFRDYSFTSGDKLRVISLKNEIGTSISIETDEDDLESIYKGASDGTIIEFDVVSVETLVKSLDNPIAFDLTTAQVLGNLDEIPDHMTGTFLVLEASSIAGGAFGENGEILKYPGFDWNHVSAHYRETTATQGSLGVNSADFEYLTVGDNAPTPVNSWRQRSVVEIYTPKLSSENKFYYEIGERRNILPPFSVGEDDNPVPNPPHGGPFILDSGDINYRPTPCKTLFFNEDADEASGSFKDDFNKFVYRTENLESFTVSDKLGEKMWNRGRPHVKYDNAATFRRFNGVTYSDAYAEDVDRLSLSSFNPTLANFYSLDSQYGACNYISNYGSERQGYDTLVAIQENKFSHTPVNTSIITDAAGSNNVALSTNVLTTSTYYAGDYGCGDHPESVLVQDNDVYFFDRSRKKVLRFSGNQLVPISDAGVSSTINDATDAFNLVFDRKSGKVVSGYNPDDNVYYITFHYPQGFSYDSGEDLKLVPLYLTADLNQDGIINTEDQEILGPVNPAFSESIFDVSFEALSEINPNVLTLTNAASFDLFHTEVEGDSDQINIIDKSVLDSLLGTESVLTETAVIDGISYNQYIDLVDADGNPIPLLFNGQALFFEVGSGSIVFASGRPVTGQAGSPTSVPYVKEYDNFITLSYNAEGGFWQSKNSYYPDIYTNQDNKMYTVKYVTDESVADIATAGNALMFHRHENVETEGGTIKNRCTFYNQPPSESFIEVVSNANPSGVKVYDALSYEGNSAAFKASIESFLGNKKGMTNIRRPDFVNKEGSYYSAIGGDISENSTNHIRTLGYVVGVQEGKIIINDAPAGAIQGAVIKTVGDSGVLSNIGIIPEEEITIEGGMETVANGVSINVSGNLDGSIIGSTVVMELPRERDGDSIRGHYAKIKLSTDEGDNVGKYELFCVNAHVTPSSLHHIN